MSSQSYPEPVARASLPLGSRHAVVTGGSRGIGAAIARRLAEAGATVSLIGRDQAALDRVAAEIGGRAAQADVTDAPALERALARLAGEAGPIAILVNNAGSAESAAIHRTDTALWERMLAVNLTACFTASRAVLPAMRQAGWGRIVNVASTAGLKGYAYVSAYVAAKHGLVGLTRALAVELARTGVTVNAVAPGFTATELAARSAATIAASTGRDLAEAERTLAAHAPIGRLIEPFEVAEAVHYLCLPASAGVTGAVLPVAGGEV